MSSSKRKAANAAFVAGLEAEVEASLFPGGIEQHIARVVEEHRQQGLQDLRDDAERLGADLDAQTAAIRAAHPDWDLSLIDGIGDTFRTYADRRVSSLEANLGGTAVAQTPETLPTDPAVSQP